MSKLTDALEFIDSCSDKQWLEFCEWMEYRGYIIEGKYLHDYDYPRVTHCKDCKYYKRVKGLPKRKYCRRLRGEPIVVDTEPDDFCSYAERKTE